MTVAKPQETNEQPVATGELKISANDLQAILAAVSQQNAEQMKGVIEAIKAPYRDKNQDAIDAQFREMDRLSDEMKRAGIKAEQAECEHFQGSSKLSSFTGPLSSIVKHQLDSGELIGICTNCQAMFRPGDPEYRKQINRKSGNSMSKAGQRFNSAVSVR
jgi:hypothetical protein